MKKSETDNVIENSKKAVSNKRVKPGDKEGNFIIQSGDNDYTIKKIKEMCIESYRGSTRKRVSTIDVYVKFENGSVRAYYVVNGKAEGRFIEL